MASNNNSSSAASGRKQMVADAIVQIERQFGRGAIMRLGECTNTAVVGISTGCLSLDVALGGQGIPRSRVTEVFGPESSGKTTLTLHCIANAQRTGGVAAFIDAEHALDPTFAQKLGVNVNELLVSQPDWGEQALEIAEMLIRSGGIDVVVVDSVAALVPKAEIEGEMGEQHLGLQARLMSQAMRKLNGALARSPCALIFINQIREKIGVMFGSPETTTGGRALKFYASVRIDIRRIGSIKNGEETIGTRARATIVKNKIAPPFRKTEFDILFEEGISYHGDLIDLAVERRVVEKSGAWFSFGSTRLGQGREKARDFLKENREMCAAVLGKVREALGTNGAAENGQKPAAEVASEAAVASSTAVRAAAAAPARAAPTRKPSAEETS